MSSICCIIQKLTFHPFTHITWNACITSFLALAVTMFLSLFPERAAAQFNLLFTSDSDIPNSLVNCIIEDKDGMIWVATEDGLLKYNGSRFVVYRHKKGNPHSIAHNFVRTICSDNHGNVLVGSISGLQVYRKYTNDFTQAIKPDDSFSPTANVDVIIRLADGDFFVGGTYAFVVHIDKDGTITTKKNELTGKVSDIHRAVQTPDGNLWVSRQGNGVMMLDTKGRIHHIKDKNGSEYNYAGFCIGSDKRLYACNAEAGLFVFNEKTRFFEPACGSGEVLKMRDIKAIPNSSLLCIATDGNGVKFYDCSSHSFVTSTQCEDPFIDLSSQKVHSLYINEAGDIWMALYQKGIFMAAHSTSNFGFIGRRSQKYDLIGDRCVTSIVQNHKDEIWVATDNGGLYGFTPELQAISRYLSSNDPDKLPTTLQGLFPDSKGRLWFGSYHRGGGIVDTETGTCDYFPIEKVYGRAYSIFGYTEDKHGTIWAAAMGNGILFFDEQKRCFRTYTTEFGTMWSNTVFYDERHDIVYAGTYDGIAYFDPKDRKRKISKLTTTAVVYSINRIDDNTLAFSSSNGLYLYDTDKRRMEILTTEDGLPTNNVYAAHKGEKDDIWISLSYGLVRFNRKTRSIESFTARDGLQGNEFYKSTSLLSRDGRLWFGGINGITYFYADQITAKNLSCSVRVVNITTEGKNIIADENNRFVLDANNNAFTIELATMPLYMTHRVTYRYRLDNGEWFTLPVNQNTVTFNGISYGRHTLYTKTSIDGHESEITETEIFVRYPWYLTWWAMLLWTIIICVVVGYYIVESRRKKLLSDAVMEHQKEEELKESKLQFFMNIVHDLRTPITLISSPLQKLQGYGDDLQHQRLYAVMSRNIERLLRLTDQIMDLRKIDRGMMELHRTQIAISPFIRSVVQFMDDVVQSRSQQLILNDHTDGNVNMLFDTDSLEKILINLLTNAIKYTPKDGTITVDFFVEDNTFNPEEGPNNLVIHVTDTGIGIPDEEKENVFVRFYQVRANGKHIKGTGIGLNLVKAFVELYKGRITVTDNPTGQGTRFIVVLPSQLSNECCMVTKEMPVIDTFVEVASQSKNKEEEGDARSKRETKSKTRKTVLIVDDDDEIRNFLCEEFAALYNVEDCADGREALAVLYRENIDLVVSDVMMPEMDGLELCRQIRQNVRINHVPVILLTAKSSDQDRLEGLSVMADAYVTKPFNIELLLTIVSNLIMRQDKLRNTFKGNELPVEQIDTPQVQSADDKLMERLLKVINENLSNPNLTSEMLATEVGLSRVHLYRKLKELTNQSATNYIRNIRLTKAAELLKQKKATISEVAYLVGYRTPNHFSTAFKELYGVSPTEYVKGE